MPKCYYQYCDICTKKEMPMKNLSSKHICRQMLRPNENEMKHKGLFGRASPAQNSPWKQIHEGNSSVTNF